MRKNTSRWISRLGAFVLLSNFVACGPKGPDVKDQYRSTVTTPAFDQTSKVYGFTQEGTHLANGGKDHNYEGSLILWKNNADPKKMQDVLDLALKAKQEREVAFQSKKASIVEKAHLSKKLAETIKPLEESIQQKNTEIQRLEDAAKNSNTHNLELDFFRKQSAKLLVDSQAWVQSVIDPAKTENYDYFCDVMLLQFAISGFLRDNAFSERPKPLGICENYYASKGMFHGPSCTPAQATAGNFFHCIWEEGILKTFTLYEGGSKADPTKQVLFINKLEDLKDWLKKQSNLITQVFALKRVGDQKPGESFKIELKPGFKFKTIYDEGAKSFTVDLASASYLKDFVDQAGITNKPVGIAVERTAKNGTKYTFNDYLFNFHALKDSSNVPVLEDQDLQELHDDINKVPALFGHQLKVGDPNRDQRKALAAEIADLEKQIVTQRSNFDDAVAKLDKKPIDLEEKFTKTDADAASKINKGNLAFTLRKTAMKMEALADGLVSVELDLNTSIDKKTLLYGCFEWRTGKSKICPASTKKPKADTLPLDLNFESASGLLTVKAKFTDPDAVGFKVAKKNENDPDFQTIPKEKLLDKTLLMELYPRHFTDHVDLVGGTSYVKDGDTILYQGNMSMMTRKID